MCVAVVGGGLGMCMVVGMGMVIVVVVCVGHLEYSVVESGWGSKNSLYVRWQGLSSGFSVNLQSLPAR